MSFPVGWDNVIGWYFRLYGMMLNSNHPVIHALDGAFGGPFRLAATEGPNDDSELLPETKVERNPRLKA